MPLHEAHHPVRVEKAGAAMMVTFNRPKALNALNLEMIQLLAPHVHEWAHDESVRCVVLRGAGDRAFCAGGDIRSLYDGRGSEAGHRLQEAFFREEYILDHELAVSGTKVPHVALYDGVTMGGGVGVSIHAPFRVATERLTFAMPETGIGFFPDVGGSFFLPRLPGQLGMFLALTGHRVKGAEAVSAGIATHYVPSARIGDLIADLTELESRNPQEVGAVIDKHAEPSAVQHAGEGLAPATQALINECFGGDSVESILFQLETKAHAAHAGHSAEWAKSTLKTLHRMSPTALKVTFAQVRAGASRSLEECFQMELRLAVRFMQGHDFYEGVRAVLVDKDNAPKWKPTTLADVTDADVKKYFAPLESHEPGFGTVHELSLPDELLLESK